MLASGRPLLFSGGSGLRRARRGFAPAAPTPGGPGSGDRRAPGLATRSPGCRKRASGPPRAALGGAPAPQRRRRRLPSRAWSSSRARVIARSPPPRRSLARAVGLSVRKGKDRTTDRTGRTGSPLAPPLSPANSIQTRAPPLALLTAAPRERGAVLPMTAAVRRARGWPHGAHRCADFVSQIICSAPVACARESAADRVGKPGTARSRRLTRRDRARTHAPMTPPPDPFSQSSSTSIHPLASALPPSLPPRHRPPPGMLRAASGAPGAP